LNRGREVRREKKGGTRKTISKAKRERPAKKTVILCRRQTKLTSERISGQMPA
jgi:hypothetical protein